MRHRHLARTEAVNARLTASRFEPLTELGFEISGRNHDFNLALQPFVERFSNLHVKPSLLSLSRRKWLSLPRRGKEIPLPRAVGADGGTRTPTVSRQNLNLVRLPISPHPHLRDNR